MEARRNKFLKFSPRSPYTTRDRQKNWFRVETPLLIFRIYIFLGSWFFAPRWKEGRKLGTPNVETRKSISIHFYRPLGLIGVRLGDGQYPVSMTGCDFWRTLRGYLVKRSASTVGRGVSGLLSSLQMRCTAVINTLYDISAGTVTSARAGAPNSSFSHT